MPEQAAAADIHFDLVFSRRKTLGIKVAGGQVKVMAPKGMARATIQAFVLEKANWIRTHSQQQQRRLQHVPERRWQHGETLWWLGQPWLLSVRAGARNAWQMDDNLPCLEVRISRRVSAERSSEKVASLVRAWYQTQGQAWLDANLPAMTVHSGQAAKLKGWQIKNFVGKWGSCSAKGHLQFSWRLFIAPEFVVRYVVWHELAHLVHFNHSAAFWQLVAQLDPNYQAAEDWLKQHGLTVLNDQYLGFASADTP